MIKGCKGFSNSRKMPNKIIPDKGLLLKIQTPNNNNNHNNHSQEHIPKD